jgi:hypothetical protein
LKGDGLINLAEEISRHHSVQAVAWLLLAAFQPCLRENQKYKGEQKDLENVQFGQKRRVKSFRQEGYGC